MQRQDGNLIPAQNQYPPHGFLIAAVLRCIRDGKIKVAGELARLAAHEVNRGKK